MKLSATNRISPDRLRTLLSYDPETGQLTWKARPKSDFTATPRSTQETIWRRWNGQHAGKPALTAGDRYLSGTVEGMNARAHQIAWAVHYGEWPTEEIDHINGDKKDNRIANLRDVSRSTNHRNRPGRTSTQSGRTGVVWDAQRGKWAARIKVNGKMLNLGRFTSLEAAIAARNEAEKPLGFTDRHAKPTPERKR